MVGSTGADHNSQQPWPSLNVKDTIAAAMRGEQTREGDYLASACRCPTGSSKVSMGLNIRASARSSERAYLHGLTLPLRVPIGSGVLTHLGGGEVLARLLPLGSSSLSSHCS